MTRTLSFCLVVPLILFGATAAQAHAHLRRSDPAAGASISTPPSEIRLEFSEGVEPKFSGIVLTPASGGPIATQAPSSGPTKSVLITKLDAPLKPGAYKVTWHAVSVDTHKTSGSFTFEVKP